MCDIDMDRRTRASLCSPSARISGYWDGATFVLVLSVVWCTVMAISSTGLNFHRHIQFPLVSSKTAAAIIIYGQLSLSIWGHGQNSPEKSGSWRSHFFPSLLVETVLPGMALPSASLPISQSFFTPTKKESQCMFRFVYLFNYECSSQLSKCLDFQIFSCSQDITTLSLNVNWEGPKASFWLLLIWH